MKKVIVIKLGGSSLSNPATLEELASVVRGYAKRRFLVVLVHGGGPAINEALTRRGITWTFINGQRKTTPEMIEVIDEVLAKDVNGAVVRSLREQDVPAMGLSGAADAILHCSALNEELELVGEVHQVDTSAIEALLEQGQVPVVAPIGLGSRGEKYNINADWAATKIAIALGAERLVFLTDQNGILDRDRKPMGKAVPSTLQAMIAEGVISGGMCTKVLAMMTALDNGVGEVRVLNAVDSSRVLSRERVGTVLKFEKTSERKDEMHGYAS